MATCLHSSILYLWQTLQVNHGNFFSWKQAQPCGIFERHALVSHLLQIHCDRHPGFSCLATPGLGEHLAQSRHCFYVKNCSKWKSYKIHVCFDF